jgi:serine/threonine protein kinase
MTGDTSTPAEETFTELLIACDESLAAGKPAAALTEAHAPGDLRPRLERGVACLRLLEQFWSTHHPAGGSAAGSPGANALTHLGRFQIRRELGQGSFGRVFLAHDPLLGRDVALKIPRVPALLTRELRQRFHHEALAAARLDHPNVVPVYEAGVVDDICFITSPYCPGITLAAWLQQRGRPLPWNEAAALLETLAKAVQHAHSRGVLHRDLKPANILLVSGGVVSGEWSDDVPPHSPPTTHDSPLTTHQPKITDFGLAKLLIEGQPDQTGTGLILGSPCYMAPEQAEAKNREITTAADVYALGAILYEMLTARPPFLAETTLATLEQVKTQEPVPPRRLEPHVPRDLETICLKCLHKDPGRRYASAHDLAEDLERFLAGEPIQARAAASWERGLKWARRQPALAALIAVTCLAVLTVASGSLWYNAQLHEALKTAKIHALEAQAKQRIARTNFLKARDAVDKMLTEVAEVRLAYIPQMELVRRKLLQEALTFYQEFLSEEPDDPVLRHETGFAYDRLGFIYMRLGQRAEAEKAYRRAEVLHESLAAEFPDDERYLLARAGSQAQLVVLLQQAGRFRDAERNCRLLSGLFEKLAAQFPNGFQTRSALARIHWNHGQILRDLGIFSEAQKSSARAVALFDNLMTQFPEQKELALDRAAAQIDDAAILLRCNQLPEAEAEIRRALAQLEKSALDLDVPQENLLKGYVGLGELLERQTRLAQAESVYEKAVVLGEKLVRERPALPEPRKALTVAYSWLGHVQASVGKHREAEQAYRQALAHHDKLPAELRADRACRQDFALALTGLGGRLSEQGQWQEANATLRRALEIRKQLRVDFPEEAFNDSELGGTLHNLAVLSIGQKQWADARLLLDQAVEQQRLALRKQPGNPVYRSYLANHFSQLGRVHRQLGDRAAALQSHRQDCALLEDLVREFPDNPTYQSSLGASLNNLAQLLLSQSQWAEARTLLQIAIVHQQTALKTNPLNPTYRSFLQNHQLSLAAAALHLGDYRQAAQAAEEVARLDLPGWEGPVKAGRFLAWCALLAGKDAALAEPARKELREKYVERAMVLIHEAVHRGFTQLAQVQNDSAFDALRPRADFQRLLQQMEMK